MNDSCFTRLTYRMFEEVLGMTSFNSQIGIISGKTTAINILEGLPDKTIFDHKWKEETFEKLKVELVDRN